MLTDKDQNMPAALSVETHIRLLKSLPVAERAAKKMGGGKDIPEETLKQQGLGLQARINAQSDEDTGIISVSVDGDNPQDCEKVANNYSEAFTEISREYLEKSTQETLDYLELQLKHADDELAQKEKQIYDFNEKYGIVELDDEMKELNTSITSLETMKMETELQSRQLETQLENIQDTFRDKTLMVAQDPNVFFEGAGNGLWEVHQSMVELEVQRDALLKKYKPSHPLVKEVDSKLEGYKRQVEQQVSGIINNKLVDVGSYIGERNSLVDLNVQLILNKTRLAYLDKTINQKRAEQSKYPKLQYEYTRILREKDVAEKLFILLYEQHQQAKIEEKKRDINIRFFERAIAPTSPVSPNRKKNIFVCTALGLMIGVGLAFLLEEMEETVRTSDDVKNNLNLPVLGSIPYSAETINKLITDVPLKSPIAEAYRRLSFFTQLFCLDPPIKSLLITSTKSDEGKSTTLANLAISMAQEGTKVLAVDTDLRRPMLHRMFGVDNSLGISSILSGELEAEIAVSDLSSSGHLPRDSFMEMIVDRLIQPASIKGLSIIPSGPLPANSIELLRSERMLSFLRCIEKKADIVIFDSPPAIHVIDSVVLAQILDGVLFVINSGRINRDEALQVKYMIESTKTPIIGVALNNIEASSPDYYYYYYYGGYGYGSRQRRKRVKLKR